MSAEQLWEEQMRNLFHELDARGCQYIEQCEKIKQHVSDLARNHWISPDVRLPGMCINVLVFGVVKKLNVCHQVWVARRWTGVSGPNPPWDWYTPSDFPVETVLFWMPIKPIPQGVE